MKILAMETTAAICSTALWLDGKVAYDLRLDLGRTHSETLQASCTRALETVGLDYGDVDYFACSCGPGSFTGLRIGLTACKTFAYACGRKMLAVSSLAAAAEPLAEPAADTAVLALLDARNRRVYAGVYADGGRECLLDEALGDIDEYLRCLDGLKGKVRRLFLAGDCAGRYARDGALRQALEASGMDWGGVVGGGPTAASVARLAARLLAENPESAESPQTVTPVYLTVTQAERGTGIYV